MIVPTTRMWLGGGRVEICGFGARCKGAPDGMDWSLRYFKKDANDNSNLAQCLSMIAHDLGVRDLYAPSPVKMNARLCQFSKLKKDISLSDGVILHRGVEAAGCDVPKGSAFIISSADCPTWAMYHTEMDILLAGHGALKELVDYDNIVEGKRERKPSSVIWQAFWWLGWCKYTEILPEQSASDITVYVESDLIRLASVCGISHKNFVYDPKDETYGVKNKKLIDWLKWRFDDTSNRGHTVSSWFERPAGSIDLHEIIRGTVVDIIASCGTNGIPPQNFMYDQVDTYGDQDADGRFLWHSNVRSKKSGDGNELKRNLVVVAHH